MVTLLSGMATGFSLIMAIGAQNAFVLKQGLKRQHILSICLICALSDSLLVLLGVLGFATLIEQHPMMVQMAKYLGAVFLLLYGLVHLRTALKGQSGLEVACSVHKSWPELMLMCLAMTWLNPHVYLDTVLLVGVISLEFQQDVYGFAAGVILSSWIFFFSLGYGARLLLPFFQSRQSWQRLDLGIALMMGWIAWQLLMG
jgi:L-lysine exporter family protein LysE/ArgO